MEEIKQFSKSIDEFLSKVKIESFKNEKAADYFSDLIRFNLFLKEELKKE